MKKYLSLYLFLMICVASSAQKRTKVSCIGSGITFGYTLPDPKKDSCPSRLERESLALIDSLKAMNPECRGIIARMTPIADGLPVSTFRAELPAAPVEVTDIQPMQGFPHWNEDFAKGVSACFAGVVNGQLLMAGGCNFPGVPAKDGGSKKFYQDIYVARLSADSTLLWRKAGKLPRPLAYGVSVTSPGGIICVGGMNAEGASDRVFRIKLEGKRTKIEPLPDLPCAIDNMTGALLDGRLYIAGGNKNGIPCNDFYSLDLYELSAGWRKLPGFPGAPRTQAVSAVQLNGCGKPSFYIWGGFAVSTGENPASLSVDGCVYSSDSGKWMSLPAPVNGEGEAVSLGGGAAVALSDSLVLCMGGVDKEIFLQALRQASPDYLLHPASWYRFNKCLLVYNSRSKCWSEIRRTPVTARAGAAWVFDGQNCFCINGELKPGIRTPEITRFRLSE